MDFANYKLNLRCLQFYKLNNLMPRTIALLKIQDKKCKVK